MQVGSLVELSADIILQNTELLNKSVGVGVLPAELRSFIIEKLRFISHWEWVHYGTTLYSEYPDYVYFPEKYRYYFKSFRYWGKMGGVSPEIARVEVDTCKRDLVEKIIRFLHEKGGIYSLQEVRTSIQFGKVSDHSNKVRIHCGVKELTTDYFARISVSRSKKPPEAIWLRAVQDRTHYLVVATYYANQIAKEKAMGIPLLESLTRIDHRLYLAGQAKSVEEAAGHLYGMYEVT